MRLLRLRPQLQSAEEEVVVSQIQAALTDEEMEAPPAYFRDTTAPCRFLSLRTAPALPGTYAQIWEGGMALSRVLTGLYSASLPSTSCLELGAGSGVAGLTAAIAGASVVLTDLSDALPYLEFNRASNLTAAELARTAVAPHAWGGPVAHLVGCIPTTALQKSPRNGKGSAGNHGHFFDMILCADVVYYMHNVVPLLATLHALTKERTTVLACLKVRPGTLASHKAFLDGLVDHGFILQRMPIDAQRGVYLLKARRRRLAQRTRPATALGCDAACQGPSRPFAFWRRRRSHVTRAELLEDEAHRCEPLDVDSLMRQFGAE